MVIVTVKVKIILRRLTLVIASAAKQSRPTPPRVGLDCFAALAM